MFAYVVKRLLSGVVVLFLISMSVFLLFWYGPSEPAQTICDNDTSNRCTPARLEMFRENLGFNNPWYEEYGKFVKGVVVGREIQFGSTTVFECPAPCLGYSYRTKAPVFEEMKERMPATFSVAIGGAFLYLTLGIPIGVAAARRRGTVADKALVSSFLVVSLHPLLPVRPADLAVPDHQLGDTVLHRHRLLPDHRESGQVVQRDVPRLGGAGRLRMHHLHPLLPRVDGRGAQRGLHPHGEGQGPAGTTPSSTSTACGPRWCPSSRSSASTSAPCSPVRSSPRRSSTSTASAVEPAGGRPA